MKNDELSVNTSAQYASEAETINQAELDAFIKEYDAIPSRNLLSDQSADEIIQDIMENEKKIRGVDWAAAIKQGKPGFEKAISQSQAALQKQCDKLTTKEKSVAQSIGLIDNNFQVHPVFEFAQDETAPTPAPIPGSAKPYACWGWTPETVKLYEEADGDRIKALITNLIRGFQVLHGDDKVAMTKGFMELGLWGIGFFALSKVYRVIATLAELTEATEAYAVLSGMMEIGVAVIQLAIAAVVLAVLVPIFYFMGKDAASVNVIINKTDHDMVLNSCWAHHGKIVAIFKKSMALDNPETIIPAVFKIYNPTVKKTLTSISAGFFTATKRDMALYGTEGALKFHPTPDYPKGVYMGWEVPLIGNNKFLVSATDDSDLGDFLDKTIDKDKRDSSSTSSTGAVIQGRMNSHSGAEAYSVMVINKPVTS